MGRPKKTEYTGVLANPIDTGLVMPASIFDNEQGLESQEYRDFIKQRAFATTYAASVIVAVIIVIGGNGQTGPDAVIGICSLPRAIDRAVRGTNYSILSVRRLSDNNHCESCEGAQSSRLAVFGGLGMSFNICRGTQTHFVL